MAKTVRGLLTWLGAQEDRTQSSFQTNTEYHYEHIPESHYSSIDDEERLLVQRRIKDPQWTIDRGAGRYKDNRTKLKRPSLVETGRHAGRSRVLYTGVERGIIMKHILKRDFFGAAANAKLIVLLTALVVVYVTSFLAWATIYYVTWLYDDTCFIGFVAFQSAFLFAIETQQTIGFGVRAPGDCWLPAWLMAMHSIWALFINSLFLGIIFAKVSHPKNRSRTILISDCAVVSRRDGNLKFMFRIADIRKRSVIAPNVRVFLYRWGPGRTTAEGEHLPALVQELKIGYIDGMMLLPITIEHDIDEASPLHGCTAQILTADQAEVVVTFEGTNEFGDAFMARRSYLSSEIFWGHVFVTIIRPAPPGQTQHSVDLARFHDVEPQMGEELIPPSQLSKRVMMDPPRYIPPPTLGDNTLVLSSDCVVASRNGQLRLMVRVGDRRPGQMLDVRVRAYVFRWQSPASTDEGEQLPFVCNELKLSNPQPLVRYPTIVTHLINPASPVRKWATAEGMLADADSEVVVHVEGVVASTGELRARTRSYDVLGHVKWGFVFAPCVVPPMQTQDSRPWVEWERFHSVLPLHAQSHARRMSPADGEEAWMRGSSRASLSSSPAFIAAPDPRLPPSYPVAPGGSGFDNTDTGHTDHEFSRAPSVAQSTSSWTANTTRTPPPTTTDTTTPHNTQGRQSDWRSTRSLAAALQQFQDLQTMTQGQAAAATSSPVPSAASPAHALPPAGPLSTAPSTQLLQQAAAQRAGYLPQCHSTPAPITLSLLPPLGSSFQPMASLGSHLSLPHSQATTMHSISSTSTLPNSQHSNSQQSQSLSNLSQSNSQPHSHQSHSILSQSTFLSASQQSQSLSQTITPSQSQPHSRSESQAPSLEATPSQAHSLSSVVSPQTHAPAPQEQ